MMIKQCKLQHIYIYIYTINSDSIEEFDISIFNFLNFYQCFINCHYLMVTTSQSMIRMIKNNNKNTKRKK